MDLEEIVKEYIDKSLHMSLATCVKNRPWVSEVHFVYDDQLNLYFRSKLSRRHSAEIDVNEYVAGNIVEQHGLEQYPHAVYFEGEASLINNEEECEKIQKYFASRLKLGVDIIEDSKKDDGHKFYKITVSNWYAFGKFGLDKGDKYELVWNGGQK